MVFCFLFNFLLFISDIMLFESCACYRHVLVWNWKYFFLIILEKWLNGHDHDRHHWKSLLNVQINALMYVHSCSLISRVDLFSDTYKVSCPTFFEWRTCCHTFYEMIQFTFSKELAVLSWRLLEKSRMWWFPCLSLLPVHWVWAKG